jgi:hypothetical protein
MKHYRFVTAEDVEEVLDHLCFLSPKSSPHTQKLLDFVLDKEPGFKVELRELLENFMRDVAWEKSCDVDIEVK